MKDGTFGTINEAVFALVFFVCRIVIGTPLTYWTLVSPKPYWTVKVCGKVAGFGVVG